MERMELRSLIYRHFVEHGTAPSRAELNEIVGDGTDALLLALHDAHMIVLDDRPHRRGEVRMALPFSAEPTDYRVTSESGSWWANCAWDALAVAAATGLDVEIDTVWSDAGNLLHLEITGGQLGSTVGFVHFQIPARHWWDDIVLT